MSYKKALADIGILREKNILRLQQLAMELEPKGDDHDDVNTIYVYKYFCKTKLCLFCNIA